MEEDAVEVFHHYSVQLSLGDIHKLRHALRGAEGVDEV
jgi:hypothetical protein